MNARRCLRLLLPLLALPLGSGCATLVLPICFGCTTPAVMCNMKVDYEHQQPMDKTGNVQLAWRWEAEMPAQTYGLASCTDDHPPVCMVRLKGPPPKFSDVCGLAKFGHEVAHAMNATH